MKPLLTRTLLIIVPAILIQSCAQEEAQEPEGLGINEVVPYSEFNIQMTIRDVMNTFIDPNADIIWEAVSFEASVDAGIVERVPETDEDWDLLRKSAIGIIEGANSLMIPGRRVAPPGSTTPYPDAEYEPLEVEEKLQQDRASWIGFSQGLQLATLSVLDAIDSRDLDAYTEAGGAVDNACTACHQQYWYRTELRTSP
jgi:hypothetical protein